MAAAAVAAVVAAAIAAVVAVALQSIHVKLFAIL